ncbi:iron hydrogenase [Volvox carteri f. nagariensis]|uniref:Iron hydrogenase n=1 Tax=Volvox carteri f. nagariensis TaxID=3068 RepID=D8TQ80_VOLCA|nr:iron hydrogenase [Volvox carteri f. nagariensis]EFJ50358.1 iron hydrogenase [Volvox carteri f. nagariensis]|eukprot:XP_002948483.1 iron hydrogenase [Volvox carteri f. nagariensis]
MSAMLSSLTNSRLGAYVPQVAVSRYGSKPVYVPCVPFRKCTSAVPVPVKTVQEGNSVRLMPAAAAPAGAAADPHWKQAFAELDKPKAERKVMIAQVAPAVRVAISESFGLAPGATTPGQLAESLRCLGFDMVFDTLYGADLTIMEEGTELLSRLQAQLEAHPHSEEPLPMFTSCCPGWIALLEKSYPELIPYVSSCKSPQMMLGAMVKTYLAEKKGISPSDISMVSIMPCVRKQGEADRDWFCSGGAGVRDVDHVITTAELGNILKERNINLPELPEGGWDEPLGSGSGAGVVFGTTGGVMEAALRTAYELVTQQPLPRLNLSEVRGMDGIKETEIKMVPPPGSKFAELVAARAAAKAMDEAAASAGAIKWDGGSNFTADDGAKGITLRVAVANGLGNAKKLLTKMQTGECKYDFVEIMACPSGCVGGGGQPRSTDKQVAVKRQQALYDLDERATIRRSHENPAVQKAYEDFLGEPNSHKAHDLLHTHYVPGGVDTE